MKLPIRFLDQNTLANMSVGESRYTLPWAMWVDSDMECWLHPDYPAERSTGGTVQMRVKRTRDGYIVFPPPGETYKPSARQPYASPDDTQWLPVVEVR